MSTSPCGPRDRQVAAVSFTRTRRQQYLAPSPISAPVSLLSASTNAMHPNNKPAKLYCRGLQQVAKFEPTGHNKVKDITVVETNYNEYALVLKHKKMDREYTQVALYGRSQKVKNDVIQKFRDFATSRGFPKDAILTPPPAGSSLKNCPPAGR
ncbi:prostaglandin D2 synthase a isoform X3 [Coregonus clupeaformis]|uniref:prostaglandin D2 synthase a isoform X3 n=1 Tax=Coregonus clupeaformis TaxID=59861 RepID=UPI001BE09248|nr:prostaglandin D2 synthase a isoform X3 [Coregonus clupeaformis]